MFRWCSLRRIDGKPLAKGLNPFAKQSGVEGTLSAGAIRPHSSVEPKRSRDRCEAFCMQGSSNSSNVVHLIEPLSCLPSVVLMELATLILTDSGCVQKEDVKFCTTMVKKAGLGT